MNRPMPAKTAPAEKPSASMLGVVICGWLLAAWAIADCLSLPTPRIATLAAETRALAQADDTAWLATLAPAEGPTDDHKAPEEKTGESHKSMVGKELSAPDKLPTVMIGNLKVVSYKAQTKAAEQALLPADLQDDASKSELNRRFHFTPYAHDPARGPSDAAITLVAFNDLACNQCAKDVKVADSVYTSDSSRVREVEVHLPLSRYSDTNLLAFYGKVAQFGGKYWEYRQKILADATGAETKDTPVAGANPKSGADDSTRAFNALVASGVDQAQARDWLTREARRFYREIDADASLAKALGLDNPPHFYLNGIHLGDSGLPRDRLPAVAQWLKQRQHYRLDNEPMARLESLSPAAGPSPSQP